jgi:hypothetical protein
MYTFGSTDRGEPGLEARYSTRLITAREKRLRSLFSSGNEQYGKCRMPPFAKPICFGELMRALRC